MFIRLFIVQIILYFKAKFFFKVNFINYTKVLIVTKINKKFKSKETYCIDSQRNSNFRNN